MDGAAGGVEDGALEHHLTLVASLDALVYVGVVVVLVVVLDGEEGVEEDVYSRGPYRGTQPGDKQYHPDFGPLRKGI